jgi:ribulose-phosphate 3-epimerase
MISSGPMVDPIVAASLLSADFSDMRAAVSLIGTSGADWIHFDVMDGRFVPDLTFGPKMLADLRGASRLPFDVHLMTVEPERLAPAFIAAGADYVTFHMEAAAHAHRLAASIRESGARPGVSIVPSTPAASLEEILPFVDLILVMTVDPGAGGQSMIPSCLAKAARLVALRKELGLGYLVSIDGGVNAESLPMIADARPDVLVMGSAFFAAEDPKAAVCAAKDAFAARGGARGASGRMADVR